MRLTLLVPELIWPEPADHLALEDQPGAGLGWLEARARLTRQPRQPHENVLAALFAAPQPGLAPLRLLGEPALAADNSAGDGHWLCADPVHLRFHQERILLADANAFDLSAAEAAALVAGLNAEFGDIGHFVVGSARRWYLRLNTPCAHHAAPLSAVAGRRVDGALSAVQSPLTRWLNEVQMFLHGHPVNQHREQTGQPAVNSLWLWGGGGLPEVPASPFAAIYTDNPLARGLALAAGITPRACPAKLADLLAQPTPATALLVVDSLQAPVLTEDSTGWLAASQALDTDWLIPARRALGRAISSLHLVAPTVYGQLDYQLTGSDRWKFWRQARSPRHIAEQLAGEKTA